MSKTHAITLFVITLVGCASLRPEVSGPMEAGSSDEDAFSDICSRSRHPRTTNELGTACTDDLDEGAIQAERACAQAANRRAYEEAVQGVLRRERLREVSFVDAGVDPPVTYDNARHVLTRDPDDRLVLIGLSSSTTLRSYAQCHCVPSPGQEQELRIPRLPPASEGPPAPSPTIARKIEVSYPELRIETPAIGRGCPPMP